jgi:peroxiredoxin
MQIGYKIDVLKQFLDLYPEGKFYQATEKELNKEINNKNKSINKIISQNKESFASKYIRFLREFPIPSKYDNNVEKTAYTKENYWNYYKMNDVDLLNSNAYTTVVVNYFKLLRPFNEQSYYNAARTIMDNVFFEDTEISAYVFEYILSRFEMMEFYDATSKLSYEYGNVCKENDDDNNLKLRIKSNTELAIGKKASDFSSQTISGGQYTLSSMEKDYTLIVFWASWCDHCAAMLPELAENISYFTNVDLITVSLDAEENDLKAFIAEKKLSSGLKIICDYQGWKGKIVLDYAVYATPVMFIVDKDLNIVAKPYNEERLIKELNKLLKN